MREPTHRVPLESSLLAWALYQPERRQLELEFRSGERYLYYGVPERIYVELLGTQSKGAFFNSRIRNCFAFKDLSDHDAPIMLVTAKTK